MCEPESAVEFLGEKMVGVLRTLESPLEAVVLFTLQVVEIQPDSLAYLRAQGHGKVG
jgi:hypothetical protein